MNSLRDLREKQGMSQRELAHALGVTQGAVSSWELGRRSPRLPRAKQIAKMFGTTVEGLGAHHQNQEKAEDLAHV